MIEVNIDVDKVTKEQREVLEKASEAKLIFKYPGPVPETLVETTIPVKINVW